jgi:effector-binding domain-containing protein
MTNPCELVELPARPTLVVRARAAVERLPQVLGPAWGAVMAHAAEAGAAPTDAPFVAYHNMDMTDLDLEIGFTFPRPIAGGAGVEAGATSAGQAAQCIHVGPYDQLRSSYQVLESWMTERGLKHAGPAYEYYLDDPQVTAPEELRTRIVLPVR